MSDEGMSDAELHKLVSCDHDKGCGMRYAACSCGYEKALESALPLLLARATAAERERDALREALADIANTINIVGSPYDALHKAIDELVLGVKKRARAALTANHSAPVVEG